MNLSPGQNAECKTADTAQAASNQFFQLECLQTMTTTNVHLVKCVRQTSHELGLDELSLFVGELRLLLDLERCGLHAELADLVGCRLQVFQV